jgi:hypothetical protein
MGSLDTKSDDNIIKNIICDLINGYSNCIQYIAAENLNRDFVLQLSLVSFHAVAPATAW